MVINSRKDLGKEVAKVKGILHNNEKVGLFQKWPYYIYFHEKGICQVWKGNPKYYTLDSMTEIYRYEDIFANQPDSMFSMVYVSPEDNEEYVTRIRDSYYPGLLETAKKLVETEPAYQKFNFEFPDTVKWFLGCSAAMFIWWKKNPYIYAEPYADKPNPYVFEDLKRDWGVTDKAGLEKQLTYLYQGPYMYQLSHDPNSVDLHRELKQLKANRSTPIIDEWTYDLYRIMFLCNNGVACGHLTYTEAYDWSLKAGLFLQELHGSWQEMHDSSIRGYCKAFGGNINNKDSTAYIRKTIFDTIVTKPNNPWTIPWDTKLTREW